MAFYMRFQLTVTTTFPLINHCTNFCNRDQKPSLHRWVFACPVHFWASVLGFHGFLYQQPPSILLHPLSQPQRAANRGSPPHSQGFSVLDTYTYIGD